MVKMNWKRAQLHGRPTVDARVEFEDQDRAGKWLATIERATSWAHSTQGALWPLSRELPQWKRDDGLLHGQSRRRRQYRG
jgi:hypothetical protein